jgi:HlyD family secretion protein
VEEEEKILPLNELRNVELKSPAVQEILGRPPRWIIRWGITVILIIISGIMVGTYFFKYPDIIPATIEVSTENLPAQLVARATGKLDTLFIADNETVEKGVYLAVIENTACFEDVLTVKEMLANFNIQDPSLVTPNSSLLTQNFRLGEVQTVYYQFIKACEDYDYFIKADYYNQKINALKRQISLQRKLGTRSNKQSKITNEQLRSQERIFFMDSILYTKKSISMLEYENAKNVLLQMRQSYETSLSSVDNIELTVSQYEQTVFDLQQQANEKKKELLLALFGTHEALQSQINQWEMQYVFISSIDGKISMSKQWQKSQHINAGEPLLSIVPYETTQITGKIMLPAQGSGKVKKGQAVNVKFDGFPHMEFGMVRGFVKNISLVPIPTEQGKFTMVEVEFPQNLLTNYGKTLDFSQQMSGSAEIITEDLRLMERFLNPIKSLIKK